MGWPQPDPSVQDPETLQVSKDQLYIYRLVRLGVAAALEGKGLAFADEVSRVIWSGEGQNWHEGDHLEKAVARGDDDPGTAALLSSLGWPVNSRNLVADIR